MAGTKLRLSNRAFDTIVQQALARIPEEIRQHLENIVITIERRPSDEMLAEMGLAPGETLFGLYWGVPLTERSLIDPPLYPDAIYLFQEPLEQMCTTREELIDEIEITVVHEIAHALGLTDGELEALGYG